MSMDRRVFFVKIMAVTDNATIEPKFKIGNLSKTENVCRVLILTLLFSSNELSKR